MTNRRPVPVIPRRTLLGAAAAIGLISTTRMAAYASGEGGEGGEGGVLDDLAPDVMFLTELGLFEATNRIIAALVDAGDPAAAQEHLEISHHAFYEDLAEPLVRFGAEPFQAEATGFADAVTSGADAAAITTAANDLFHKIDDAVERARPADLMAAAQALVQVAALDFEGGVQDGQVIQLQEYRDAWGFTDVARRWLTRMVQNSDATVAAAASAGVTALEPALGLFPDLTPDRVPGDSSVLHGAAARIEIAALRLD